MNKKTIRFYAGCDRYIGWEYVSVDNMLRYLAWLKAGNYFMISNMRYNTYGELRIIMLSTDSKLSEQK